MLARLNGNKARENLNSELLRKAAEQVGNPNVLVNLISRRVRQLTAAGGTGTRPLVAETVGMGAADLALLELVEGKMGYEMLEAPGPALPPPKKRRRS